MTPTHNTTTPTAAVRAAVRAARHSPSVDLRTVAAAVGVDTADLLAALTRTASHRGRCCDFAAEAAAAKHPRPAERVFALTHRAFPPAQARAVDLTPDFILDFIVDPQKRILRSRKTRAADRHNRRTPGTATWAFRHDAGTLTTRRTVAAYSADTTVATWLRALAANTTPIHLPEAMMWAIASRPDPQTRIAAARCTTTPPLLQILATDPDWEVRAAAAANPNCAEATLKTLASHRDHRTGSALCDNPNLPTAIARLLHHDPSAAVRRRAELSRPVKDLSQQITTATAYLVKKLRATIQHRRS